VFKLSDAKPNLWKEVFESGELLHCFNCGSCISGCPASEAGEPLLIRNLARKVILGLEEELEDDDSPWACVTCSRCEEMCPMDVKPFELALAIRRWQCSIDDTRIPPVLPEFFERGYTQPVEQKELRQSLGLDELPSLSTVPGLLDKFQAMLREVEIIKNNAYMFGGEE